MEWQEIKDAPFGVVLEVKNGLMEKPVLASRGYIYDGMVHEDLDFFTTHYTPDPFFPTPPGNLCCPTHWRHPETTQ